MTVFQALVDAQTDARELWVALKIGAGQLSRSNLTFSSTCGRGANK